MWKNFQTDREERSFRFEGVLVACVLGALYVGFAGFILVIVWTFWGKGDIPGMVATAVGGTGLLAVFGYLAWKAYREVKNRVD